MLVREYTVLVMMFASVAPRSRHAGDLLAPRELFVRSVSACQTSARLCAHRRVEHHVHFHRENVSFSRNKGMAMKKKTEQPKKRILARVVAEEMKVVSGGWRHTFTQGVPDFVDYDLD
jgi:hypothetical protein